MNAIRPAAMAVGVLCLAAMFAGCHPSPPYNIEVRIDEKDPRLAAQSIEVNVIAVGEDELPTWEQMSVNKYWKPNNPLRSSPDASSMMRLMTFAMGQSPVQIISKKDEIWDRWLKQRGATHVVVLAYLPWITEDQPGSADQRRAILPLSGKRWKWSGWGDKTIPIKLLHRGLVIEKELKPE